MVRNKSPSISSGKSPVKKSSGKNGETSENTSNDLTPDQDLPRTSSANIHKQNIYIVSFPIICLFNILRSILYQLFVIFRYIFTTSYRVVYRPYRKKDLEIVVSATKTAEVNEMSVPKVGPGPGDPLLAKQKHHHRRAFEYISKALKIDEENEGQKEIAIELYRKGIRELEYGIAVDCWGGRSEVWERAQRLHDKMQTNLSMARDRLHFLEILMETQNLEIDKNVAQKTTLQKDSTKKQARPVYTIPATQLKKVTISKPPTDNKLPSRSEASGQKLTVGIKRPAHLGVMNKSQTLPRSMGSKAITNGAGTHRQTPKPAATPPAIRRQFSISGSPIRKGSTGRNTPPPRSRTPVGGPSTSVSNQLISVKGVEQKLVQIIMDEIVEGGAKVEWNDIAGQEIAKQALQEMVILPSVRPELFTGLRSPAKGLLLFGPPGNGKTLLARAVATECSATFFNISAASLTSKYVGDGEKLVRALFAIAREMQPSIIFIDEVDSLLSERSSSEHEASRRLKTEFLVEFDGLPSNPESDRVVVLAATNRPQELDEAALRRFPKRVYVSLPDLNTRELLLKRLLAKQGSPLSADAAKRLAVCTEGYSGSDLTALAKDAALEPIRELNVEQVKNLHPNSLRAITENDFTNSLKRIRRSVAPHSLLAYEKWSEEYGDITM
ncbi:spastin isoform X1 [Bradysia coprophila]|uniref:spastin isoform X1 n=2 Tax=Bradysia coprophila TaxID=38358 RepID=UPI00187DCF5D|nr:spastin isoform X1 [Bradysia coprophila]